MSTEQRRGPRQKNRSNYAISLRARVRGRSTQQERNNCATLRDCRRSGGRETSHKGRVMKRRLLFAATLVVLLAGLAVLTGFVGGSGSARAAYPAPHPTVTDYQFIKATTPTEADCEAVARTCFTPQALRSAYNVAPLYNDGWKGNGITIAIVDSYGSDTMAHDLHVFDSAFGLQPMCGE